MTGATTAAGLAVEQVIRIAAPRARVFALLSDVDQVQRWMPMTVLEPRVGGRIEFRGRQMTAEGEVTEFTPPEAIAYTWDWREAPIGARTEVRFALEDDGDGTIVRLTHRGFLDQERVERHEHGWGHYIARIKVVAEGGDPGPDDMGA